MKTVLITGGSRGIGAACARRFAAAGYAVAINYNYAREKALALVRELENAGGKAMAVQADVAKSEEANRLVDNVLDKFCQLDTLICNAGVAREGLVTDFSDEEWRFIQGVNLDGVFYCCRAVIPHFVHRKAGRIVTVSSMWGLAGAACEVPYSASKAAVIGLTKALAKELGPSGITVNCVAPGVIDTEMNKNVTPEAMEELRLETPLERIGTAEDVAESIFFLASDAAKFITGQVLSVDGGIIL